MAFLRAKQKAQVIEKLSQVAPPGDRFIACVHAESGPSPWLNGVFGEIPLLGLIIVLTRRYYFLTLTSSHVVVNTANRWNNRPGDVVAVYPRHAFPVSRVKRASIWSSMYLQMPGDAKPVRLNIHRIWRTEMDQLSAAFPVGAIDPGSQPFETTPQGQPYPPQGQPMIPQQQGYAAPQQPYPAQQGQPYPAPQAYPAQQGQPYPPQQPYPGPQAQPYPAPQAYPAPPAQPYPQQQGAQVPPQGQPYPPQVPHVPYPGQPGYPAQPGQR